MALTRPLRVLATGDSPWTSTGYGTVWNNRLRRWVKLRPDWQLYFIDWHSRAREHKDSMGYTTIPMGKFEYGYDAVEEQIMKKNPDILVTLCDVGYQAGYINVIQKCRLAGWRGTWFAYTPLDNDGWALTWDEFFKEPDVNVAMAGFGKRIMDAHKVKNSVLIPHGVDTTEFYPLPNRDEYRRIFKVDDKFVVGFVGRNQRRKMIDRVMEGFSHFAKGKDDVVLMLHTDKEPSREGWSIPYLIHLFGIRGKCVLTKEDLNVDLRQRIDTDLMNVLYNLQDVFLYGTGGEGFGLPGIECQSAGTPLLMTDFSTAEDLCRDHNKIPVLKDVHGRRCIDRGANGVHFAYPDDIAAAELLEKYYQQWKEGKIDRLEPRKFALTYDWDLLAPLWIDAFEKATFK